MEFKEYTALPNVKFEQAGDFPMLKVGGPLYSGPDILYNTQGKELCASTSISPFPEKGGKRLNDPITDRFFCSVYENKFIFALAQSSGPGAAAASEYGLIGFAEHFSRFVFLKILKYKTKGLFYNFIRIQSILDTTQETARCVQRAFAKAHEKIMSKKDIKATTQLLGGIFSKLESESRWAFVACSVGHCKAFCIRNGGNVVDVTMNNYLYKNETPQGYLGPPSPNLSNMRLYCYFCNPKDVIILTTSGIHNNFHPQHVRIEIFCIKL